MPQEIANTSMTQGNAGGEPLDLSTVHSAVIEHHIAAAFNGATSFEIFPGQSVDVETLTTEYSRRCQASSDFNRP